MHPVPADHLGVPGIVDAEVIGRGGFGTVHAAWEPEFGRRVAVKVLTERIDGEGVRRAFARECRAMGSLSGHPHIVSVHRGGTTPSGEPYIVMDFLARGSLADRLRRDGSLPWAEVLEVGVTMAGALETAHRAGVLHLDVKPANILVSRFGEPKLGDFGISRLPGVTEGTMDGQVRASAVYAAPERLLTGTASPAADLYGLGATLFALLSGAPAFSGSDLLATVARAANEPVPDLRPYGVPDPVARVVEHLMAKMPAHRPPTAAAAAQALQAAQQATGQEVTRAVVEGAVPAAGNGAVPVAFRPVAALPVAAPPGTYPPGTYPPGTSPPEGTWDPHPPTRPAQQAAAMRPARPAPPDRSRRTATIVIAVAAVVVVLGGAGIAVLLTRTVTSNAIPVPTVSAVAAPTPPPPDPTPPPAEQVTVASGVDHPDTENVRTVLQAFVSGIDERRYADAFARFSPDSDSAKGGIELWTAGQSTTSITNAQIVAVRDAEADGEVEADLTFTSQQSAEYGPNGQTCTNWELTYEMTAPGPDRLIRKARPLNPPRAC